ncbi:NADPH-dependent ferric siderophore reductase [Saccharomonospora piscinae]|uniref:NADPH-dependent ferric siderophore reductase n=1 Tax=Saccharomonospora piscinae TaxID=687388 RepID=A0A1V9AD84_SACPI|nr:siderophore-interacting protein [Saccharomonospora piscinae]OQO95087.1 NADPH-dependent ferric siderophore reductase [Saccharomonospora piscinae]
MIRTTERRATHAYRLFQVEVRRAVRLGPSFVRVTFTGPELDAFADNGFDQRIKVVFPLPGRTLDELAWGTDWHERWRALPERERPALRTYTVRAVRPASAEVDVEFVVHGDSATASRWAAAAAPGDRVGLVGPDARYPGEHRGVGFRPPSGTSTVLLAGDETAVPAVVNILERLPSGMRGVALLEVPHRDDVRPVVAPAGVTVTWLARHGAAHGSLLIPAVSEAAARRPVLRVGRDNVIAHESDGTAPIWEVPDPSAAVPTGTFTWLAGEAGVVTTLRRRLVGQLGVDPSTVAFMGYWRRGANAV